MGETAGACAQNCLLFQNLQVEVGDVDDAEVRRDICSQDVKKFYPLIQGWKSSTWEETYTKRYEYLKKRDHLAYESIKGKYPLFRPSPLLPLTCTDRLWFALEEFLFRLSQCKETFCLHRTSTMGEA